MVGLEPTIYSLHNCCFTIKQRATYDDVLPQLMNNLLDYPIQHTKYLSSCGLLDRSSRPMVVFHTTNHSNCDITLSCKTSNTIATLSHTYSQAGFVLRSTPLVTLCLPVFPFRGLEQTFFPTHLLHSYIHQFY